MFSKNRQSLPCRLIELDSSRISFEHRQHDFSHAPLMANIDKWLHQYFAKATLLCGFGNLQLITGTNSTDKCLRASARIHAPVDNFFPLFHVETEHRVGDEPLWGVSVAKVLGLLMNQNKPR
jgi:hypothetical protein